MNATQAKTNIRAMCNFITQFQMQKHIALENLNYIEFEELSLSPIIHFKDDLENKVNIDRINSKVYLISAFSNNYSQSCSILNENEQSTDSHC